MPAKKTIEQFIKQANVKHNSFYTYEKFIYGKNNKEKSYITCPIHGEFLQSPNMHLKGEGCRECRRTKLSHAFRQSKEQFVQKSVQSHGAGEYDYSLVNYINSNVKVLILCKKGHKFYQEPHHHQRGVGCPECIGCISKASQQWLDYLGIPNIIGQTREVRFKLGNKIIIVDGYDPETNTVYEFHGDYWHGNPNKFNLNEVNKVTKKTFGELLQKTQKRSRLIKSHGFNLVSIWESDWEILNQVS